MATFTVTFNANNSAFDDGYGGRWEIAEILEGLADRVVDTPETEGKIRDSNGNHIGSWNYNVD